jgi:hypothetical protein
MVASWWIAVPAGEVAACSFWLEPELTVQMTVALIAETLSLALHVFSMWDAVRWHAAFAGGRRQTRAFICSTACVPPVWRGCLRFVDFVRLATRSVADVQVQVRRLRLIADFTCG